MEQIDVSINLIEKYSDDFQLCRTANDVEDAIRGGRIASLFGLEGYVSLTMWCCETDGSAHSLGNSLGGKLLQQFTVQDVPWD
jgi:membrane dipeptidase